LILANLLSPTPSRHEKVFPWLSETVFVPWLVAVWLGCALAWDIFHEGEKL
jgi:hypothetical protein